MREGCLVRNCREAMDSGQAQVQEGAGACVNVGAGGASWNGVDRRMGCGDISSFIE